jgi:hypothetical protein
MATGHRDAASVFFGHPVVSAKTEPIRHSSRLAENAVAHINCIRRRIPLQRYKEDTTNRLPRLGGPAGDYCETELGAPPRPAIFSQQFVGGFRSPASRFIIGKVLRRLLGPYIEYRIH